MKKYLLLISLLITVLKTVIAQQVVVTAYVEKTHVGPKSGTSIGHLNEYGWEYGAFYQESSLLESMLSEQQRALLPRFYEREFFGAYFTVPLVDTDLLSVRTQIRTGVVNREYFIITPSFLGDIRASKNIRFGLGVGTRALRPTWQLSYSMLF